MPTPSTFVSRGRDRRSRSKSPHYRSYHRSRSRSPQRFASRDQPASSSHGRPSEQRMRLQAPGRRRRSPNMRSISPRRRTSAGRSMSPRRRTSAGRSISPRRRTSAGRSMSPRRRPSAGRSMSPRRRPSAGRSMSPRRRPSPGRRHPSPVRRTRSPRRRSSSLGRRSRSVERRIGRSSPRSSHSKPSSVNRESHLSSPYVDVRERHKRSCSPLKNLKTRSRSPIESSRRVGPGFLSARERSVSPRRRVNDSPEVERWQSRKETPSPRRKETVDSRNVVYDQHGHASSIPDHTSLNITTDRKPIPTEKYDKPSQSQFYQDSGRGIDVSLLRQTLDERFKILGHKPLILDENITIGIQRYRNSIPSSNVNVTKVFDSGVFTMLRGRDEGEKPIFDREDIKMFRYDDNLDDDEEEVFERRIIRVQPVQKKSSLEHSRGDNRYILESGHSDDILSSRNSPHVLRKDVGQTSWPDKHLRITRQRSLSPHGKHQGPTVHIRLDAEPDVKYDSSTGRGRQSYKMQEKMERIQKNPHDLRHNLTQRGHFDPRMDARAKIEARRLEESRGRESSRDRENWEKTRDREERERFVERDRQVSDQKSDSRSRSSSGRALPDFSRRTDKYKYEEWREKPELIPKGPSYFEHDDREGFQTRPPFGRGGFSRGRGRDGSWEQSRERDRGRGRDGSWERGRERDRGRGRGGYSSSFDSRESTRDSYSSSRRDSYSFPSNRSRGRGSFSRPYRGSRGSYRGFRSPGDRGQWKHDMFDKLEKNEDDKPSSTTKDT